jgi:DivIVA domain-containing protein
MARSVMRSDDPDGTNANVPGNAETGAAAQPEVEAAARETERPARRFPSSRGGRAERDRMLKDARAVKFPAAVRGYDRAAVDRYVKEVNRLLAELEISASPEAAVRHALDEVSEETRELLQRAQQTAEEITMRSRAKADDRLQQAEHEAQELREAAQHEAEQTREAAKREAQQLRENAQREAAELRATATREVTELSDAAARESHQLRAEAEREAEELRTTARRETDEMRGAAETRARELTRNAETIWRERRRLIEDIRAVGEQLLAVAEAEAKRFPPLVQDQPLAAESVREQLATITDARPPPHELE